MKFDLYSPTAQLQPCIKQLVVAEHDQGNEYKVLPSSGLVIVFQYKGRLAAVQNSQVNLKDFKQLTGDTPERFKRIL